MKIAIHGKRFIQENKPVVEKVFELLWKRNADLYVSESYSKILKQGVTIPHDYEIYSDEADLSFADIFFSIGGDGTLLEGITHIGKAQIPVLGINIGKLGFLATTSEFDLENAITDVFDKKFSLDKRTLLRLDSSEDLFNGRNFALNDFTILKKDSSSMIVVHAYINEVYLNSYWADGVIVATPTGSTGYSLSCGGPIIYSKSNDFIITPVSPHNLTMRPVVVPDSSILTFKIEGQKNNVLISLDSRYQSISQDTKLTIKKEDFHVNLVELENYNFFDTLRQKLKWGLDVRN